MDIAESIEELIEKLDETEPSNQGKVFKQMNIPISDFETYGSWDKESYTRNCIYHNNEYELILLCWKKGDATPIHGHDNQKCWVYQLQGEITEIRYEKNSSSNLIETNQMQLTPGKLAYMDGKMGYHKLNNDTDGRAMTLHFYASPIRSCEVFNDKKDAFEIKELEYDTINTIAFATAK